MSERRDDLDGVASVSSLARLETLLERQIDGQLSPAELQEVRELLWDDAAARQLYADHCDVHAMLVEEQDILALLEEQPQTVVTLPSGQADRHRADPNRAAADAVPVPRAAAVLDRHARGGRGLGTAARLAAFGAACAAAGVLAALSLDLVPAGPSVVPAVRAVGPAASRSLELVRETVLPDGSRMELAPKSVVATRYAPLRREVTLEDGEAHFSVEPDERRPFVVTAGGVRVEAVGTAFNVRRAGERVVVTVSEGKIAVSRVGSASAATADQAFVVSAGSQIQWDAVQPGPVLAAVDPSGALSWREGRLEYTSEPLRAVLHDVNRYSDRPVVLRGQELGELRVAGTILTAATSEWVTRLPDSLPVQVTVEEGAYVISPRERRRTEGHDRGAGDFDPDSGAT